MSETLCSLCLAYPCEFCGAAVGEPCTHSCPDPCMLPDSSDGPDDPPSEVSA